MLESSGSILQLHTKTALSNMNLLLVTNQTENLQRISDCLQAEKTSLSQVFIDIASLQPKPSDKKYAAILYDYLGNSDRSAVESLIEQLQWWRHLYPDTPLILITDVLGDESAVKLIQSGINGYVIRHKLYQLPLVLKKSLFDFASNQALIKQQQLELQKLQSVVELSQETAKTQDISWQQQQDKIKQLELEIKSWVEGEQTKQEHLAHLNHELRSPISSMLGFAGMLHEQYYGALNERQMRYVNAMMSVGQYMLDLVNNYLDIAKIDANKQTLDLEKLAVGEVCQNALFCLEKKAEQKGLELELDLAEDIDFCLADSRCLRQILINLLSNAVKFTERGNVTLEVKHSGKWLNFAVIDTGSGISAANITKLFAPFPQISNHPESTGLGLALSRKLALLHQGDITVTSELDQGTCFTLSIPRFHQQSSERSHLLKP
ncbi:MAG: HAMP domain-containing sensor histidine kinase [Cyanobacteria bacterium P01_C01_bin.72]